MALLVCLPVVGLLDFDWFGILGGERGEWLSFVLDRYQLHERWWWIFACVRAPCKSWQCPRELDIKGHQTR